MEGGVNARRLARNVGRFGGIAAIGVLTIAGCGNAESKSCPTDVEVCDGCKLTSAPLVIDLSRLDLRDVQQLQADYDGVEPPYPTDASAEIDGSVGRAEHVRVGFEDTVFFSFAALPAKPMKLTFRSPDFRSEARVSLAFVDQACEEAHPAKEEGLAETRGEVP